MPEIDPAISIQGEALLWGEYGNAVFLDIRQELYDLRGDTLRRDADSR